MRTFNEYLEEVRSKDVEIINESFLEELTDIFKPIFDEIKDLWETYKYLNWSSSKPYQMEIKSLRNKLRNNDLIKFETVIDEFNIKPEAISPKSKNKILRIISIINDTKNVIKNPEKKLDRILNKTYNELNESEKKAFVFVTDFLTKLLIGILLALATITIAIK